MTIQGKLYAVATWHRANTTTAVVLFAALAAAGGVLVVAIAVRTGLIPALSLLVGAYLAFVVLTAVTGYSLGPWMPDPGPDGLALQIMAAMWTPLAALGVAAVILASPSTAAVVLCAIFTLVLSRRAERETRERLTERYEVL
jgi:hypothetical protein